jgi:hypothetical protein
MADDASAPASRAFSGRVVVGWMFGFAVVMIAAMFVYWELHTRPFRPLQLAIAAEFEDSGPRVVGGRHKSHRPGAVPILRVVINVDYDPTADANAVRRDATARRLAELAEEHHGLRGYEQLELHLVERRPEQESRIWTDVQPTAQWLERISAGAPPAPVR